MRAVDGVSLTLEQGEVLGHRRRIGLGQERHHAGADGPRRLSGPRARPSSCASRPRPARRISDRERRQLTGKDVAMIFQEPTTSLNPCFTIGFQLIETLRLHERHGSTRRRKRRAIELLEQVGIPSPEGRAQRLPAPALRRHEPARHDRDGDRLQSEAAHRRRADDGARRHHPGADPRPAACRCRRSAAWRSC